MDKPFLTAGVLLCCGVLKKKNLNGKHVSTFHFLFTPSRKNGQSNQDVQM